MKKGEKREKTRARDASRALAVVILVLKEEGGRSRDAFDASRAPRARQGRRREEVGAGAGDAGTSSTVDK